MLPTGVIDPSFIEMNSGPYFNSLQGGDYHVFPDGRVLMSGAHVLSDTARGFEGLYNLIWFTNTGYLDTTRVHRKGDNVVFRFRELADGKFICGGTCNQFDGEEVDWIFRVHADGSVDTTFHTGVNWGAPRGYLPLADGRVYTVGNFRRAGYADDTLRVVRFMSDGSLDPDFTAPHFSLGAIPDIGLGAFPQNVQAWSAGYILVTGRFQYVDGQPRRGLCVLDSTGALMDDFDDCGVDPFTYMGSTNASVQGIVPDADSTHYYIWGRYNGYDDGTTNDPLQRFVTRLHGGDITTGVPTRQPQTWLSIAPNPTTGSVTVQLEQLPNGGVLVVRDALGREVLRQRMQDHYTTLNVEDSGVYVVELWDERGRLASERVLVE